MTTTGKKTEWLARRLGVSVQALEQYLRLKQSEVLADGAQRPTQAGKDAAKQPVVGR